MLEKMIWNMFESEEEEKIFWNPSSVERIFKREGYSSIISMRALNFLDLNAQTNYKNTHYLLTLEISESIPIK